MSTSYAGFVADSSAVPLSPSLSHGSVLASLEGLRHLYQTDVTQPFGLFTKLSKTYVTRCLLGDKGTTYKYLGLRMFSSSWFGTGVEDLRRAMEGRLEEHLRSRPGARMVLGYDVALVNKMVSSSPHPLDSVGGGETGGRKLKDEPTFGSDKSAVSWHADSSLRHYSSIGVYHVTVPPPP